MTVDIKPTTAEPLEMSDKANKPAETSADEGNLKRAAEETEEEAASSSSDAKRSKPAVISDVAITLGIKAGDRLEVQWEIGEGENTETRWWRATLLEYDGETVCEGVAIRELEYDAWPEGGFPEKSKEQILFLSRDTLVDIETQEQMTYNLLSDDGSAVVFVRVDEVETMVNSLLEGALSNVSAAFNGLPRAQQAFVAEQVASKKTKFVELLQNHLEELKEDGKYVLTDDDAQRLLAQAIAEG